MIQRWPKVKEITINVTERDIAKGYAGSSSSCPIAFAARRALKGPVSVGTNSLTDGRSRIYLPHAAVLFIYRFDRYRPVEPFEFKVAVQ